MYVTLFSTVKPFSQMKCNVIKIAKFLVVGEEQEEMEPDNVYVICLGFSHATGRRW